MTLLDLCDSTAKLYYSAGLNTQNLAGSVLSEMVWNIILYCYYFSTRIHMGVSEVVEAE